METKLRFTAGTVGRGGGGRGVVLVYRWLNLVGMILGWRWGQSYTWCAKARSPSSKSCMLKQKSQVGYNQTFKISDHLLIVITSICYQ